jgi:probable rRNA maturation factor
VAISNRTRLAVRPARLRQAIRTVLTQAGVSAGQVDVLVVGQRAMQALNRAHLAHDWPTDVISFAIERSARRLEGAIVVCAAVARRAARRFGWTAADELLLYTVHGALHLVGYSDHDPAARARMRRRERRVLASFGLRPRYDD